MIVLFATFISMSQVKYVGMGLANTSSGVDRNLENIRRQQMERLNELSRRVQANARQIAATGRNVRLSSRNQKGSTGLSGLNLNSISIINYELPDPKAQHEAMMAARYTPYLNRCIENEDYNGFVRLCDTMPGFQHWIEQVDPGIRMRLCLDSLAATNDPTAAIPTIQLTELPTSIETSLSTY